MSRSFLSRAKDAALKEGVLLYLRPKVQRYGHISDLSLDTSAQLISATIQLLGEPTPLVISEAKYRVEQIGEKTFLVFHDIKVSREWLQNLLTDKFQEIRVPIPSSLKNLLGGK